MLLWLLFLCSDRKDGALGNGEFAFLKFSFFFKISFVRFLFCGRMCMGSRGGQRDSPQELVLSFHCEPWDSAQLLGSAAGTSHPEPFPWPMLNWKTFFLSLEIIS